MTTNLKQQLTSQAASQRKRQLDLREQALIEREKLLDDTERLARLDLLDKQIVEREERLSGLEAACERQEKVFEDNKRAEAERAEELKKAIQRHQNAYNQEVGKREQLATDIAGAAKQLNELRSDISERRRYLADQEKQVNDTIAEWNIRLNELHAEAKQLEEQKVSYLADTTRLAQARQSADLEIAAINLKVQQLEEAYQAKVVELKADLANLKQQINAAENALQELDMKQQAHIEALATREQSLAVREQAVGVKELDLNDREQRLNMKLNLVR